MLILVDTMGADNGIEQPVMASKIFVNEFPEARIALLGDANKLSNLIASSQNIQIIHAEEEITCHDEPASSVRKKKKSSLVIGCKMLREGQGDALISAGSTGAILAASTLYVRRLKGIKRMALAPILPSQHNCLLIDAGANMDCKPEYLQQFGLMGSIFMEKIHNVENPRVGILNVGKEKEKGDTRTKEAYELLSQSNINFIGNIEAREALTTTADVLVCDGFSGNVLLKTIEGTASFAGKIFKDIIYRSTFNKMAGLVLKKDLENFYLSMDASEAGGAPLLGADGCVIKIHGNSNERAFYCAMLKAMSFVSQNINEEFGRIIGASTVPQA